MTVFRNEGAVGPQQRRVRRPRIVRYDKRDQTPAMHHIDYGLGLVVARACRRPAGRHGRSTWPTLYHGTGRRRATWPASRCTSASTRSARSRVSRTSRRTGRRGRCGRQGAAVSFHAAVPATKRPQRSSPARSRRRSRPRGASSPRRASAAAGCSSSASAAAPANASHAVNDFRKIVGIEAYAPTDNVSELTARTNDEGWETVFAAWLSRSRLGAERRDARLLGRRRQRSRRTSAQPRARAQAPPRPVGARHRHRRPRRRLHRDRSPTPA